ncbi:MAG: putative addiction module antidote protein [Bdellovibrio sp.]|nr:MAG: putative addiction module antidote protein [Bdellovibrio sp.]
MAKNKVSSIGSGFAEHLMEDLRDPRAAAMYLMVSLEDEDVAYFKVALGNVARAHGIGAVSKMTEIPRPTLYNILKEESNPSLATIFKVLNACGLKIAIVPSEQPNLAELVGATPLPRTEVVKKLMAYIKEHGLIEDMLEAEQKEIEIMARESHHLLQRARSTPITDSPKMMKKRV